MGIRSVIPAEVCLSRARSLGLRLLRAACPVIVAAAALSCQIEAHDTAPSPGGSLAEAVAAASHRMHVRFAAAERLELAIAHSDLDRAHAEAHALAQLDEPDALPAWRPYFESIRDAAHQIEAAPGAVSAARLAAVLGRRCASCHQAVGARIVFPTESAPPGDPRLAMQMVGHQWAAAQMWQGLIGPSDDRWRVGAHALTEAPLHIVALAVTPDSELDIDDVARLRLYARRAEVATSQDARADLFGTLLATCTHCHAVLRDR